MAEQTDLEVLRRPYTRSMPPTLRSIAVLHASFLDVTQQWQTLLAGEVDYTTQAVLSCQTAQADTEAATAASAVAQPTDAHRDEGLRRTLTQRAKQSLGTLARLTGQIKAIKQELIAHRAHVTSATDGALDHQHDTSTAFFATLLSAAGADDTVPSTVKTHDALPLLQLCQRVWLWTLLFALLLSDMELLSGTISYAVSELFASADIHHTDDEDEDDAKEEKKEDEEWRTFFALPRPPLRDSQPDDAALLHGCAILYDAFVGETHPRDSSAHKCSLLQPWFAQCEAKASDEVSFRAGVTRLARAVVEQDTSAVSTGVLHTTDLSVSHTQEASALCLATVVRLLVRLLTEMLVRPQWAAMNMQNAFRPIPVLEAPSTAAAAMTPPPNTTVAVAWQQLLEEAAQSHTCAAPSVVSVALVCHVWQLCCLERFSTPWPVPPSMLQASLVV